MAAAQCSCLKGNLPPLHSPERSPQKLQSILPWTSVIRPASNALHIQSSLRGFLLKVINASPMEFLIVGPSSSVKLACYGRIGVIY